MTPPDCKLTDAGEAAVMVTFDAADPHVAHRQVLALDHALRANQPDWLIDTVVSYCTLLVNYQWQAIDHYAVKASVRQQLARLHTIPRHNSKQVCLPVLYGYPADNDLPHIAHARGITVDEVVRLHHSSVYRAYGIGFAPGFCFLGDVNPRIQMPRLDTPRRRVPKGAVGIAASQTAVYPQASPGGWNIIGLCPLTLFSPSQTPPMPFSVGDEIRFRPIDKNEFTALGGCIDGA